MNSTGPPYDPFRRNPDANSAWSVGTTFGLASPPPPPGTGHLRPGGSTPGENPLTLNVATQLPAPVFQAGR